VNPKTGQGPRQGQDRKGKRANQFWGITI
jgi:hypothetical protein